MRGVGVLGALWRLQQSLVQNLQSNLVNGAAGSICKPLQLRDGLGGEGQFKAAWKFGVIQFELVCIAFKQGSWLDNLTILTHKPLSSRAGHGFTVLFERGLGCGYRLGLLLQAWVAATGLACGYRLTLRKSFGLLWLFHGECGTLIGDPIWTRPMAPETSRRPAWLNWLFLGLFLFSSWQLAGFWFQRMHG